MEPPATPPKPARALRLAEVLDRLPVSKSTWWAGIKTGRFPAPTYISERIPTWPEAVIDALVQYGSTPRRANGR